jgi:hypothetical protein
MPHPSVMGVKVKDVPSHQTPHGTAERDLEGTDKKMKMVRHQRPGIATATGFFEDLRKVLKEYPSVQVIAKYLAAVDTTIKNVVNRTKNIESSYARHENLISNI